MAKTIAVALDRAYRGMRTFLESSQAHIAANSSNIPVTHANGLKYAAMVLGMTELLLDALDADDTDTYVKLTELHDQADVLITKFGDVYKLYVPTLPAMQAIESIGNGGSKPVGGSMAHHVTHAAVKKVSQRRYWDRRAVPATEAAKIAEELRIEAAQRHEKIDSFTVCSAVGRRMRRSYATVQRIARGEHPSQKHGI